MDFNEIFSHTQPYSHTYPVVVDALVDAVRPLAFPTGLQSEASFVEYLKSLTSHAQALDKPIDALLAASCRVKAAAFHGTLLGAVLNAETIEKVQRHLLRFAVLVHLHLADLSEVLFDLAGKCDSQRIKAGVFYLIGAREEALQAFAALVKEESAKQAESGEPSNELTNEKLFLKLAELAEVPFSELQEALVAETEPLKRLATGLSAFHKASRGGFFIGLSQTPVPVTNPSVVWESRELHTLLQSPLRWAGAILLHTIKSTQNENVVELASISSCAEAPVSIQLLLGAETLFNSPSYRPRVRGLFELVLAGPCDSSALHAGQEDTQELPGDQYIAYLHRVALELEAQPQFFSRRFREAAAAFMGRCELEIDLHALPLAPLVLEMVCPQLLPQ